MKGPVPTLEELGVEDWFLEEKEKKQEQAERFEKLNAIIEGGQEGRRRQEYGLLNGMLFLLFVAPALFSKLMGWRISTFHSFVYVWVHEAGHGFYWLIESILGLPAWFSTIGGTSNEVLTSVAAAIICFTNRQSYVAGCILVMCTGMSIQYAGWYMQSAQYPYGIGFGGIPITASTHDWTVLFGEFGLLERSYEIGRQTEQFGHAIAVIFLTASLIGYARSLYGWTPKRITDIVSPAAAAAAIYLIFIRAQWIEIIPAVALSTPILLKAPGILKRLIPNKNI